MTGGVLVDGRFDSCPYFRSYSVSPLATSVAAAPAETDGVGGAGGSSGSAAGVIKLVAAASDIDGLVTKVEFWADGEKVGEEAAGDSGGRRRDVEPRAFT